MTTPLCTAALMLATPQLARAEIERPLPHPIGQPRQASTGSPGAPGAPPSPWTPLTHQPSFLLDGAANPILLTDGSVLVQDAGFPDWWRLTPDQSGSYINGTWTQVASLPATYSPLYHASAVLPDGRLIIEGGEDLLSLDQTQFISTWSAQGAIFDPLANTWTPVAPPPFFTGFGPFRQTIGDAQSVVLANGTFMLANCCSDGKESALLDPRTLTWTRTGTGKFDDFDEEGWTLLPDGKVLTTDAFVGVPFDPSGTSSEIYDPATGAWSSAGSTINPLWDSAAACGGEDAASLEVGPAVLRPDGTVFSTGGNACGAAHTAIYDSRTRRWKAGPDFPDGLGIADGPAALEPNGKVVMMASPGVFNTPSTFLEWDGTALSEIPGPPNAPFDSSFFGSMLVLPTGQILLCDFSNDIEIFTPTAPDRVLEAFERPLVTFTPVILQGGGSYEISGFRFNGVSQGAAYGDDFQGATNYPLVRIKNLATGHVFYSRTHDHSSMAVASNRLVSTHFDVPAAQERGVSVLEVVANGVASPPVVVVVR
ncbi:MAG TPA: kelch repeat-containing protein [Kofleriaceae bacterium]|nr:kelch repeat-containing protein [Kofleriaceae bacterium]